MMQMCNTVVVVVVGIMGDPNISTRMEDEGMKECRMPQQQQQ